MGFLSTAGGDPNMPLNDYIQNRLGMGDQALLVSQVGLPSCVVPPLGTTPRVEPPEAASERGENTPAPASPQCKEHTDRRGRWVQTRCHSYAEAGLRAARPGGPRGLLGGRGGSFRAGLENGNGWVAQRWLRREGSGLRGRVKTAAPCPSFRP